MHYTQLFRRLREQKGLSHEELARAARCHRNTVLNVESGRRVKFTTLARLAQKLGYGAQSPEMSCLALLWLEASTGIDLSAPRTLDATKHKVALYERSAQPALTSLNHAIRRNGLDEAEVRLLEIAARRPEVLAILRAVCDLVPDAHASATPGLRVAEDAPART